MNRQQRRRTKARLQKLANKHNRVGRLTIAEYTEMSGLLELLGEQVRVTNAPATPDPEVLAVAPYASLEVRAAAQSTDPELRKKQALDVALAQPENQHVLTELAKR